MVQATTELARLGLANGDLSAYNLLVHEDRLVIIDIPQLVDVIAHPRGAELLDRDALNISRWFEARGLGNASPRPADLPALLRAAARFG
jgi:RIO kinase 1